MHSLGFCQRYKCCQWPHLSPQLLPAGSMSLRGISDPRRAPCLPGAQWELHIQRLNKNLTITWQESTEPRRNPAQIIAGVIRLLYMYLLLHLEGSIKGTMAAFSTSEVFPNNRGIS